MLDTNHCGVLDSKVAPESHDPPADAAPEAQHIGALGPSQAVPESPTPLWAQVVSEPSQIDFSPLGTERTPIEGAQHRAIKLPQLIRLRDFLMSHASPDDGVMQWVDRAPPQYSATSGQALNVHAINLYQVRV